MKKYIQTAIYANHKLDLDEFCKVNHITKEDLLRAVEECTDESLRQLFLNRYPQNLSFNNLVSGENIIKQILKAPSIATTEISKTYKISQSELFRILKSVEETNPELFALYTRFRKGNLSISDRKYIEQMEIGSIETNEQDPRKKFQSIKERANRKETESVFETEESIRDRMYDQLAEEYEELDDFLKELDNPDVEKMIQNRWKKEQVVIKIFEEECGNDLKKFHAMIGKEETSKRILEAFDNIDKEDNMVEIITRRRKGKNRKPIYVERDEE